MSFDFDFGRFKRKDIGRFADYSDDFDYEFAEDFDFEDDYDEEDGFTL